MGWELPVPAIPPVLGYTGTSTAAAVQPGRWPWLYPTAEIRKVFATVDGSAPSGGGMTVDVVINGSAAFTITLSAGLTSRIYDLTPAVLIQTSDLVTFEITASGGATGVPTFGFLA